MKDTLYALSLDGAEWQKSSYSNPENCVEVTRLPGGAMAKRDSRNPSREPLRFDAGEWHAFVQGAAAGEFD